MELASRLRWAGIILGFLLALVLIGWGMYSVARSVFNENSNTSTSEVVSEEDLYSVESAGEAVLYIDGPTVAADNHRSVKITVRPSTVTVTTFKNYGQEAIDSKGYLNSQEGYRAFLSALAQQNVLERREGTTVEDDFEDEGVCSSGRTYVLELDNDVRRWSTSCSTKQGTVGFNMTDVRRLFQNQAPDFRELTRGTGL